MRSPVSLSTQAVWLLSAKIVGFACNLALPVLLARVLAPREYGLFKQAFLTVSTLTGILPMGMALSAFYFLAREPLRRGQAVFNILLFHGAAGALVGLILGVYPGLWETFFPGSPELAQHGGLTGFLLFLTLFSSLLESIATANQDVRLSTGFIAGAQSAKSLLLVAAALWRPELETLLWAGVLHAMAEGATLFWYLRRAFPGYWRSWDKGFFMEQAHYALPLGAAGLVYIAQTDLPNYFVSWRYGPAAYAVFANGNFQIPLIGLVRDSLSSLLISRMSGLQAEGRTDDIATLNDNVSGKLMLLYFPAAAFCFYFAADLIRLVYGPLYDESVRVFRVALLAFPLQAFVLDPVLRAYAEHRYYLLRLRGASVAALAVVLAVAGRSESLVAIMAAVVLTQVSERVILIFKVRKILGQKDMWRGSGRRALAAAAAALAPLAALELIASWWGNWPGWVRLGGGAILYAALYLPVPWAFGWVKREDLPWKRDGA